jgi:hypothetical protein
MKRYRETTTTTLVLEALRRADDFRTVRQLMAETQRSSNRVTAALHSLRKYGAVDCLASDGILYWYAQPPQNDTRMSTRDEYTPESKPRKVRKPRAKKVTP